jgi:hypothetical protein
MPQVEIHGDPSLHLTTALLIYEQAHSYGAASAPIVTQHPIKNGQIQPGQPLDLDAFKKLLEGGDEKQLAVRGDWSWQFPRMLAEHPEFRMWWSPAAMKNVFIGYDGKAPRGPQGVDSLACMVRQPHDAALLPVGLRW